MQKTKRELQRAEIIDATWRIVAARGFESLTMRELATEIGMAHGAVKYYFSSKDQLLEAALLRAIERSRTAIDAVQSRAMGVVALRRVTMELLPLGSNRRIAAAIVVAAWGRSLGNQTYRQHLTTNNLHWRQLFRKDAETARDLGHFTPGAPPPNKLADLLATMIAGAQPMSVLLPVEANDEQLISMTDSLISAFLTPSGLAELHAEQRRVASLRSAGSRTDDSTPD